MAFADTMNAIQQSPLSLAIQDSGFAYPLIEGTHVMSLALSVGMILWIDLRLLGVIMRGASIRGMYASVRPWLFTGFCMMLITGVLLVITRAGDIWDNNLFHAKLILLALCGVNILVYHLVVERDYAAWDTSDVPPPKARIAGGVSLALWFTVIAVGRIMAYTL